MPSVKKKITSDDMEKYLTEKGFEELQGEEKKEVIERIKRYRITESEKSN